MDGLTASRPHARFRQPLPAPGERYVLDFGIERTAMLRRMAADFAHAGVGGLRARTAGDARTAIFPVLCRRTGSAAGTAAQVPDSLHRYGCRSAPSWALAGDHRPISRACTLTVEDVQSQSLPGLAGRLGRELSKVQQGAQAGPKGERPAAACRALLQLDDMVFGPFAGVDAKVERLDSCCSQCSTAKSR